MNLFKFFTKEDNKSKDIAKERLKLVLLHDRANVSPKFLEMIKSDISKVISNYMEIDDAGFDLRLSRIEQDDDSYASALVANIPIKRMKNAGKNNG
ncbi:MAG TPA: cell division topological specificity factor MinE [Clostridiales bacterium]|nr:cell division topological specificity factor MinE [Clostridia bacterium]MDD4680613.1 cell division topological specificity factor MinE [Clostridia bacterium]HCS72772.1 cell division topological specificity factor MinE [Clostridiales bacterium]